MNYEVELDDLLIQLLIKMYGVNNEEITYKIFLFRFLIECYEIYRKTNINNYELNSNMPDFLISELNLPLIEGNVYYKNERLSAYPDSKNSLANILDNWFFRYADTFALDNKGDVVLNLFLIEKEIKNIFYQAEKSINLKKAGQPLSRPLQKSLPRYRKSKLQDLSGTGGQDSGF